jgi:hypothetical protein
MKSFEAGTFPRIGPTIMPNLDLWSLSADEYEAAINAKYAAVEAEFNPQARNEK